MLTELYKIFVLDPDSPLNPPAVETLTLATLKEARAELSRVYRQLSIRYHPDKANKNGFTEKEAKEKTTELNNILDVLKDTKKTIDYLEQCLIKSIKEKSDHIDKFNSLISIVNNFFKINIQQRNFGVKGPGPHTQIFITTITEIYQHWLSAAENGFATPEQKKLMGCSKDMIRKAMMSCKVNYFKEQYKNNWNQRSILKRGADKLKGVTSFIDDNHQLSDEAFLSKIEDYHKGNSKKDSLFFDVYKHVFIRYNQGLFNISLMLADKMSALEPLALQLHKFDQEITEIEKSIVKYKSILTEEKLEEEEKLQKEQESQRLFEEKCKKDDEERRKILAEEYAKKIQVSNNKSIQTIQGDNNKELTLKTYPIFLKIYNALYDGQTSLFKSSHFINGLPTNMKPEQLVEAVKLHAKERPHSRTVKAIDLLIQYYPFLVKEDSSQVDQIDLLPLYSSKGLVHSIHEFCYQHSGMFKKSSKSYKSEIDQMQNGDQANLARINTSTTRSAKILRALR